MSTGSATPNDATVDTTNTSSTRVHTVVECDNRGGGVDSSLLEIMGPTTSELQQLSALDVEGPLAPANSLESLDSRARPSEGARSLETPRSSFGSSDRAEDQLQPVPRRGDPVIKESTSEKAKAQRPSHDASTVPLACGAVLMIVFLVAFAYGVFLFRLAHASAPVKKTGMQRSANDTGADRG
ncbi:hypothetical protein MRX96_036196 [Rhipicephalus microplus]